MSQQASAHPEASVSGMSSVLWWNLRWQTFANIYVVVLCAQHCASSRRELLVRERTHSPENSLSDRAVPSRTLKFELCNGFANQRIALASGIIFATLLDRYAVLPEAVANGIQITDDWRHGESEQNIQLSDMYDTEVMCTGNCWRTAAKANTCIAFLPVFHDL